MTQRGDSGRALSQKGSDPDPNVRVGRTVRKGPTGAPSGHRPHVAPGRVLRRGGRARREIDRHDVPYR